jgi:hypothetical protein
MHRRRYLATVLGTGSAALAGCSFFAEARAPPPSVPQSQLRQGGWEQTDESHETVFEREVGPTTVTGISHTSAYADTELAAEIEEKTLGSLSTALSIFSASRVDFSPNIDDMPAGIGQQELMDQVERNAKANFEARMAENGLEDISEDAERTIRVDTGERANLFEYSAVYPFEGISFQITEEEAVDLEGTDLGVHGRLADWQHNETVLIAGGVYPAENYATTSDQSLSDAVDVTVDVDLGLTPNAYRQELLNLMKAVR